MHGKDRTHELHMFAVSSDHIYRMYVPKLKLNSRQQNKLPVFFLRVLYVLQYISARACIRACIFLLSKLIDIDVYI